MSKDKVTGSGMFSNLKDFAAGEATLAVDKSGQPTERDVRIATGVLLLALAHADNDFDPAEAKTIVSSMREQFNIESDAHIGLILEVSDYLMRNVEVLNMFVSVINENFNTEQKQRVLAMVWKVIKADGLVNYFELSFACDLRQKLELSVEQALHAQKLVEKGQI